MTEKYDLENIKIGLNNPKVAFYFFLFAFLQLLLSSKRISLLMQVKSSKHFSMRKMLAISWASSFLNCVTPSSVFAELYRIRHLMTVDPAINKDNSIYTSVFSKIFSVISLATISVFFGLYIIIFSQNSARLFSFFYILSAVLFFVILFVIFKEKFFVLFGGKFKKLYSLNSSIFFHRRLDNFKDYFLRLSRNKKDLFGIAICSIFIQILNTVAFILIIYSINPGFLGGPFELMSVIPIGIFLMTLPISFSGLGLGHLAFFQVLSLVGIQNGSDVFSIYFAFNYIFDLLGVLPFIFLTYRTKKVPER